MLSFSNYSYTFTENIKWWEIFYLNASLDSVVVGLLVFLKFSPLQYLVTRYSCLIKRAENMPFRVKVQYRGFLEKKVQIFWHKIAEDFSKL